MAAGNRQQYATGRGEGEGPGQGSGSWTVPASTATSRGRGLALPVALGLASALGLLVSYVEIGPTSFRIAIFSCIIAGFVAALFHRRSMAHAEQVVMEERQERLAVARELREELARLLDAVSGARGAATDLTSLRSELASLTAKVDAVEQYQATFRDSLMQEMNPGRGRRRGRTSGGSPSADGAAVGPANGAAAYGTSSPAPGMAAFEAASYERSPDEFPVYEAGSFESAAYSPSYEPSSHPDPSYPQPLHASTGYPAAEDPALARRSWSGTDATSTQASDADTADHDSADYAGYDIGEQPAPGSASADRRLAEIFTTPERGHEVGTSRPSWTAGAASNGAENGSTNGSSSAANGAVGNEVAHGTTGAVPQAGHDVGGASPARSALWESSAASRLTAPSGVAPPAAARTPWETESTGLPPGATPTGRSAAAAWDPTNAEQRGRISWSATDTPGGDDRTWTGPMSTSSSSTSQPSDDEDPVAAAARYGSPRRGRPSDEDPNEVTPTQHLSASEQTAVRQRFLDLGSLEDDGWHSRR